MPQKIFIILLTLICSVAAVPYSAWARLVIHSQAEVEIELLGFDTLAESSIFKGKLAADSKQEVETAYRGLALLVFTQGQTYPIILGDKPLTVQISNPGEPSTFVSSKENQCFYRALIAKTPVPEEYPFAALMVRAKELLDSSHTIHTVAELQAKKKEFRQFVANNFPSLRHSDMIRRLISQSFMMHEYVDYHVAGAPATEIKKRYQQEVLAGVADWLRTLSPHIPEWKTINYCVSLYYNRSMVTLASLIIDRYKDAAYCPGDSAENITFPDDLQLETSNQKITLNFGDIKGSKIIAFVSEQCPVSMVATVSKARILAKEKNPATLIVAPLEKLSDKHLAMSRMLRNGNLMFVGDEKWRQENLEKKIKLPLFISIKDEH